jgi:Bifunctional DNA primase/polymerase, N-terminal
MIDFRSHALFYVSLGWRVIPLAPGSKVTLIPKDPEKAAAMGFARPGTGVHDATDDTEVIVGIATGKPSRDLLVFDIDVRKQGCEALLRKWLDERKNSPLPKCPLALTRSGGYHALFDGSDAPVDFKKVIMSRVPDTNTGKMLSVSTGLEIKWTGGYIVAPPSVIYPGSQLDGIGGTYQWIRPPLGPHLPKPPKWFWKKLEREPLPKASSAARPAKPDAQKLAALVDEVVANGSGNRDNILFWAANRAVEEAASGHYSSSQAYDALYAAGISIGQSHYEVRRALRQLGKITGGAR